MLLDDWKYYFYMDYMNNSQAITFYEDKFKEKTSIGLSSIYKYCTGISYFPKRCCLSRNFELSIGK